MDIILILKSPTYNIAFGLTSFNSSYHCDWPVMVIEMNFTALALITLAVTLCIKDTLPCKQSLKYGYWFRATWPKIHIWVCFLRTGTGPELCPFLKVRKKLWLNQQRNHCFVNYLWEIFFLWKLFFARRFYILY